MRQLKGAGLGPELETPVKRKRRAQEERAYLVLAVDARSGGLLRRDREKVVGDG